MKDKPYVYKRVIAYLIDMIIIALIASLLINVVVKDESYPANSKEMLALTNQAINGEITQEDYDKQYNDLTYELNNSIVDINIIMCGISLIYYVVFCYYTNGSTVGKKIMHLQIVSNNGKELHLNNYLIRALLINRILLDIIDCAMIIFLSKNSYILAYSKISSIYTIILLISVFLVFYRNDGRGLHDLLANTKVINVNKEEVQEIAKVQEAVYEEMPNTIQIDDKEEKEENKEEKKKAKKKKKNVNESPEGVSESERI